MRVEISDDVISQQVSGETVLLDLASQQYFGLDSVGTRIWALLREGVAPQQMIGLLLEEYEIDRTTLEADVAELLERLAAAGLIRFPQDPPE